MGLRAIGQEDPVRAYQIEGFDMFDAMIREHQGRNRKISHELPDPEAGRKACADSEKGRGRS